MVTLHPRLFVLARFGGNSFFKAVFCKNRPAFTWHQISCKFFACKLSSLGPGAELLPQATEIRPRAVCGPPQGRVELRSVCVFPSRMHPFPAVGLVFAVFFFFSRRIPSWIPPFPSLVGRFLVTFWPHCAHFWLKLGCYFFVMFFGSVFGRFLTCF